MASMLNFLDLFAGAGGLSEGFVRAGFNPIAHVEADAAACFTLKTRQSFHWLKKENQQEIYIRYLNGEVNRNDLYDFVPSDQISAVINEFISHETISSIFERVDKLLGNRKLDLIIGGPPCQAYSIIGRARGNMVNDLRNHLYIYYGEFLKRYAPKYFVFENVLGLLSAKDEIGELYFDKMRELFKSIGYSIEYKILSANEYGILQSRKRVILVGKKETKSSGFYPEPNKWHPEVSVWELFSDLPRIKAGEGDVRPQAMQSYEGKWLYDAGIKNGLPVTWHQSRPNTVQDLEIYRIAVNLWNNHNKRLEYNLLPSHLKSHKFTQSFTDRFKVVAGNLPVSHTVIAHISKDGHYYIHPDIEQNRSITPREAARIQAFPDDYYFESLSGKPSRTSAFKQIGNAVPVLLSQKIAEQLLRCW